MSPFRPTLRLTIPALLAGSLLPIFASTATANTEPVWSGYAGNPQHSALSAIPSQSLQTINWSTPVDLQPQYRGDELLIHYGSPVITASNTVIVPVKTGDTDNFELRAFNGSTGAPLYTLPTDYSVPSSSWIPAYSPALTPDNRLYYPGAGGTVYFRDNPDAPSGPTGQIAFFGNAEYNANAAAYNNAIKISTPITADNAGNIYFGFRVSGQLPQGSTLTSGIARIAADGTPTFISTASLGLAGATAPTLNCAPALSPDGHTLYITVNNASGLFSTGYLAALNASTLQPLASVPLHDPRNGKSAYLPDISTASPTIAPNGDVYIGTLENPFPSNNDRGWLLHFSADLSQSKTPGAFGWDDTPSIVPASMVPSYHGPSSYLLMSKYNNYAGVGSGDGNNKLAILDPASTMTDPVTGATVMNEVLTISGVTPDGPSPQVREWCINTAVVDPATDSILVNSEDGTLYRWNLATNSFTESINLTEGIGEAYTPTLIGADGQVYAINNATLFAVRAIPEPTTLTLLLLTLPSLLHRRRP